MVQRLDSQPDLNRHHRRSHRHRRYLRGGIAPGEDPGDQPEPEPEPQPGPEPEKVTYNFTSFSADGETQYGTGTVETTGQKKTFGDKEYTEAEVKTNSEPEWVGRKFYIISTAEADGTTKYPLYDAEGQEAGVQVTITPAATEAQQGAGTDTSGD